LDGADASVARATEDARRYRDEARHYERTGSQRVDLDELRLDVTESVTRGVLLLTDALRARDNEPMESSGIPARYDGDPDAPADDERPAHTIDRAATRLDTLRRNVMLDVSDGDAARKAGRALDRRDAELANAPRARSYPDVREVGFY
jgi:hypothetical protein